MNLLMKLKIMRFMNFSWLSGIDAISNYTGYGNSDIMDWIFNWIDCPVKKLDLEGIWVVRKRDIKKFIKEKSPPKTEIPEQVIHIKQTFKRERRW